MLPYYLRLWVCSHHLLEEALYAPRAGLPEFLHHLPHLGVLIDELVYFVDLRGAALRYPLAPAGVQERGALPLFPGHGVNYRLDPGYLLLVYVDVLGFLYGVEAPHHPQYRIDRSELLNLLELVLEVVERELVTLELLLKLLCLLLVELGLGLLDERQNVAHVDNPEIGRAS